MYAIMNVKTCHKGYPKDEVSHAWIEIDPRCASARHDRLLPTCGPPQLYDLLGYDRKKKVCNRETRGLTVAFKTTAKHTAGTCQIVAAGHNAKVPMLLIATASTLIPADPRVKTWKVVDSDGHLMVYTRTTAQTQVACDRSARAIACELRSRPGVLADACDLPRDISHCRRPQRTPTG